MAEMKVGIMSAADYRARTLAIARGEYKPKKGEPKVWFESIQSMAQVLSENNLALLAMIRDHRPRTLGELAELSGRAESNLSRTLKALERHSIVSLERTGKGIRPKVNATDFHIVHGLKNGSRTQTVRRREAG